MKSHLRKLPPGSTFVKLTNNPYDNGGIHHICLQYSNRVVKSLALIERETTMKFCIGMRRRIYVTVNPPGPV